jgi:hypothetical protein
MIDDDLAIAKEYQKNLEEYILRLVCEEHGTEVLEYGRESLQQQPQGDHS